ncbi:hypothetical protein BVRB_4g093630 [Beta vulgaris subsp. vulgaris]|nr:hypothetical protein BVRB_4g093630 [Beta vulgaris subsp. vulgaris]
MESITAAQEAGFHNTSLEISTFASPGLGHSIHSHCSLRLLSSN